MLGQTPAVAIVAAERIARDTRMQLARGGLCERCYRASLTDPHRLLCSHCQTHVVNLGRFGKGC